MKMGGQILEIEVWPSNWKIKTRIKRKQKQKQ